jgi:hypothetical protein
MLALPLEDVGRVHAGEGRLEGHLELARRRVGPLLDGDDLGPADPVIDDAPHAGG